MKKLILLICSFIFIQQVVTATHTWIGGNGNWDVAANWDMGTVPTSADSILILSDSVLIRNGVNAVGTTLTVGLGATLSLRNNATLTLSGSDGQSAFYNSGSVLNAGTITVSDVVNGIGTDGSGISNSGFFLNKTNGEVIAFNIDNHSGIYLNAGGSFSNKGTITITAGGISGFGIFNSGGDFVNKGSIDIIDTNATCLLNFQGTFNNKGTITLSNSGSQALTNSSDFVNNTTGIITINGGLIWGLGVTTAAATFNNKGYISIANVIFGDGLRNIGQFSNSNNSFLRIENTDRAGIANQFNSTLINKGEIDMINAGISEYGIYNDGDLSNKTNGSIMITFTGLSGIRNNSNISNHGVLNASASQTAHGIENYSSFKNKSTGSLTCNVSALSGIYNEGSVVNDNNVTLLSNNTGLDNQGAAQFKNKGVFTTGSNQIGIQNAAAFQNTECGLHIQEDMIDNLVTGNFVNKGLIDCSYTGVHLNAGTMINKGVIGDINLTYSGVITNQRVITESITGPLVDGVPVSNALNLAGGSGIVFGDWKVSIIPNVIGGTYDPILNEFTPNADGDGADTLYVSLGTSCRSRNFTIPVISPPQPRIGDNNTSHQVRQSGETGSSLKENRYFDFAISPNPSEGDITLYTPSVLEGPHQVSIYNSLGKLVHLETLSLQFGGKQSLSINNTLSSGIYWLSVVKEGKLVWQDKLIRR